MKPAEARREVLARLTRLAATGLKLSSVARGSIRGERSLRRHRRRRARVFADGRHHRRAADGVVHLRRVAPRASAMRRDTRARAKRWPPPRSSRPRSCARRSPWSNRRRASKTSPSQAPRHALVMRAQRRLVGLSVAAITYYSTGVLGYLTKAAVGAGMALPMGLAPEVARRSRGGAVDRRAAAIARMKRARRARRRRRDDATMRDARPPRRRTW